MPQIFAYIFIARQNAQALAQPQGFAYILIARQNTKALSQPQGFAYVFIARQMLRLLERALHSFFGPLTCTRQAGQRHFRLLLKYRALIYIQTGLINLFSFQYIYTCVSNLQIYRQDLCPYIPNCLNNFLYENNSMQ